MIGMTGMTDMIGMIGMIANQHTPPTGRVSGWWYVRPLAQHLFKTAPDRNSFWLSDLNLTFRRRPGMLER
jgi:hypothetical protein